MDGWTLFFIFVGVSVTVNTVFKFLFMLDDPRHGKHKRK